MKTNKNGVKLLATVAVLAMVFAAFAAVIPVSDADAEGASETKYNGERDGPLDFTSKAEAMKSDNKAFDNYTLKNQIEVTYDEDSKTYTVNGILAKQDLSADTAFKALWQSNTEYTYGFAFLINIEGTGVKVAIGDGNENTLNADDGGILYIKDAKASTVKIGDDVYTIDFSGVTLIDEIKNNPTNGYVIIPNSNALAGQESGIDGNGGKWALSDDGETLTLTNYNGKEYFDGAFTQVILVGDNTIEVEGVGSALKSSAAFEIKSVDGLGSLTVKVTGDADVVPEDGGTTATINKINAIQSTGKVTINGVTVNVTVEKDMVTATELNSNACSVCGIKSTGFEIYDGELNLDVAANSYFQATGLYITGAVDIKSSEITINAGSRGISTYGDHPVTIAASTVDIEADQIGIRTGVTGGNNAKVSITNASQVNIEVFGLAEGYAKAYGVSAYNGIDVQSDSVLTTDGILIYNGTSTNNATIVNEGEMVIWNGATFDNKGKFTNNGTVGVYGTFGNSAGETVNNGAMANFGMLRADGSYKNQTLTVTDDKNTQLTIKIRSMMPQADGTFLAEINANNGKIDKNYVGTIVYSFNSTGVSAYSIDAVSENGSLQVDYDSTATSNKYSVFASDFDGFSVSTEKEVDVTNGPIKTDGLKTASAVTNDAVASITVTGGKLSNEKTLSVNKACKEFINGGEIVNNGDLNVNASITMKGTGAKISGNDAIVGASVVIILAGDVDMRFSHSGEYTTTAPGSTTSTTTKFTDVVSVKGKVNEVTINTTPDTRMKGFIAIGGMTNNTAGTCAATVTVEEGAASITGIIGSKMVLAVATGATLQVATAGADANDGVIAVQDGATFNMKIASDRNTASFGTLIYTISFANEGYTYYGSLQYALANAAEGATLELNGTATISETTAVKAGITLNFKENATLTISGTEDKKVVFSMGEGAKFVLAKGTKVTIAQNYVTASGTFEYDGNVVALDKAVFDNSDATIAPVLKTNTVASSVTVNMDAVDGKITADKGTVTGTVKVNYIMDDTVNPAKLKTTSSFAVSKDAIVEISITDNKYSKIVVEGTLKLSANTTINGKVEGDGAIVLKDGASVAFGKKAVADITVGNGTDAFVFDNVSGTATGNDGKYDDTNSKTFAVTAIAKSGNNAAYVTISGEVLNGTIESVGNTAFGASGKFTLGTKAVAEVPADAVLTIKKVGDDAKTSQNTANGLLKVAGKINMKVENVADSNVYGTLNYQITYTDGSYTVYTMLATGVSNAKAGDSFTITKDLPINDNMDVPSGVTIIIAEGKKITVADNKYIAVGTPITALGATGGIQGTIELGQNSFVIVYADDSMDMSKAVIKNSTGDKAKNSQYTTLNQVYATVYVDTTNVSTVKTNVEKVLVPEIDGYRFLGWKAISTPDIFGETDYEANMKASQVQVIFKHVDGIKYYIDNNRVNTENAPVWCDYGSTVTAVADYGYTGTALVNGKEFITIDSSTKEIVGSGVTAASSAGSSSSDDGMGITDYLLIVLVVLAAILVVIVALRMMRS